MKKPDIFTGHFDCCGDMICAGSTVATRRGEAVVIWTGRWMLHYDDTYVEPLNRHGKNDIRRCDNGPVTMCDNKSIVTG